MLEVRENRKVRVLDLITDEAMHKKMFALIDAFNHLGVRFNFPRSGPLIKDMRVVEGKFHHVIHIDESAADKFLEQLQA